MCRTIVIVGGGIAATTCLETLVQEFDPKQLQFTKIVVISASRLLTKATDLTSRGRNLESFEVREVNFDEGLSVTIPQGLDISFVHGFVKRVNPSNKTVIAKCDETHDLSYRYDTLVLCIGSSPKELEFACTDRSIVEHNLLTIRDGTSVETLRRKLRSTRRVAIVGNGGISLGLADRIRDCEKVWIVLDKHIGNPFLDSEAAKFIITANLKTVQGDACRASVLHQSSVQFGGSIPGPALGPYWLQQRDLNGALKGLGNKLEVIYESRVEQISTALDQDWVLTLTLSDGRKVDCDLVISAIGVRPNKIEILGNSLELSQNGSIIVDEQMRTSLCDIYAAGDVVSCQNWPSDTLWFKMCIWTQARQMGHYCGRCISSHLSGIDPSIYNNFDCFSHATNFFGMKVILLGLYNLQGESILKKHDLEILVRSRPNRDHVKLVIRENRVIGAILIGDSGLDETIENIIYDQLDIEHIKEDLLNEIVDIEDYFD